MKKMTLRKRHSSRMLTSRLPTLRGGGGGWAGKLPVQCGTSQAILNMSRARGPRTLYGGGGEREVGGYLYREVQVEHVGGDPLSPLPMMHWPPTYRDALHMKRMTDTTENITSSQLSWRVVGLP